MKAVLSSILSVFLFSQTCAAYTADEYCRMLAPQSSHKPIMMRGVTGAVGSVSSEPTNSVPEVAMRLQFPLGSDSLTPLAQHELLKLASALDSAALQGFKFVLEGHTCNLGSAASNLKLSKRRAQSVERFLLHHTSLSAGQFDVLGFGESMPLVPNIDEAARRQNRRVIIRNTMAKAGGEASHRAERLSASQMKIYRFEGERKVALSDGETLRSGDNFALSFNPGEHRYAYICQKDGHGSMAVLFPDYAEQKNPLMPKRTYAVPGEGKYLTLDSTLGKEQIVLLTLDKPLVDTVQTCAEALNSRAQIATRGIGGRTSGYQGFSTDQVSPAVAPTFCDAGDAAQGERPRTRGINGKVGQIGGGSSRAAAQEKQCRGIMVRHFFMHR